MIVYYTQALGEGKCIASAHWLNDVLTEQKMFPPRNAIHFPTAFKWQFQGAENYVRFLITSVRIVTNHDISSFTVYDINELR